MFVTRNHCPLALLKTAVSRSPLNAKLIFILCASYRGEILAWEIYIVVVGTVCHVFSSDPELYPCCLWLFYTGVWRSSSEDPMAALVMIAGDCSMRKLLSHGALSLLFVMCISSNTSKRRVVGVAVNISWTERLSGGYSLCNNSSRHDRDARLPLPYARVATGVLLRQYTGENYRCLS